MGKLYENLKNLQGEIKLRAFDISFVCCYGINLVLEGFHLLRRSVVVNTELRSLLSCASNGHAGTSCLVFHYHLSDYDESRKPKCN